MLYKIFFLITIVLVIGRCRGHRGRSRYYEGEDEDYDDGGGDKCPQLNYPKGVGLRCKGSGGDLNCIATCLASHVFKGTGKKKMIFRCKGGRWKPRSQVPRCVSDGKCKFDQVKAGRAECQFTTRKVSCQISCDKGRSGKYVCRRDGSWKPPLPSCVRSSRRGNEGGIDTDNFDEDEDTDICDEEASSRERYGQGRKQKKSRRPGFQLTGQGSRGQGFYGQGFYGQGLRGQSRLDRGTCPKLRKPKSGRILCKEVAKIRVCTGYCYPKAVFKGTDKQRISLYCKYNNRWAPRSRFPDCVSQERNRQHLRRPGFQLAGQGSRGQGFYGQGSRGQERNRQHLRRPGFQLAGQGSRGQGFYGQGSRVGPWTTGDIINCQQLRRPKNARVRCKKQDKAVVCSAECSSYTDVFKGTDKKRMTLKCYYGNPNQSGRWSPRRSFPDCVNKVIEETLEYKRD